MARSGSGRVNRGGTAIDASSGLKVKGRLLQQDPVRNIWTTSPDVVNAQKFVRAPGPDGLRNRIPGGISALLRPEPQPCVIWLGGATNDAEQYNAQLPQMACTANSSSLRVVIGP